MPLFEAIEDQVLRDRLIKEHEEETAKKVATEVAALKAKNDELLGEKKTTKEKLDETLKSIEGIDLEEAKKAMRMLSDERKKKLLEDGKLEEYIQTQTQTIKSDYEAMLEAERAQRLATEKKAEDFETKFKSKILEDRLREVATKSGCTNDANVIRDIINRGREAFSLNSDMTDIEARDSKGNLKKTADGKMLLTPELWGEQLKIECPHYFPSSTGTGATGSTRTSGFGNASDDLYKRMNDAAVSGNSGLYKQLREEYLKATSR